MIAERRKQEAVDDSVKQKAKSKKQSNFLLILIAF